MYKPGENWQSPELTVAWHSTYKNLVVKYSMCGQSNINYDERSEAKSLTCDRNVIVANKNQQCSFSLLRDLNLGT